MGPTEQGDSASALVASNLSAADDAVDATGHKTGSAAEHTTLLQPELRHSRPDSRGCVRATAGFQLVSSATPAQYASRRYTTGTEYPGERDLARDLGIALGPFLAEMPLDAALIADYLFTSVGDGGVDVRCRLLVETSKLPASEAMEQAAVMRDELAVCLRVLAEWYAFERVRFTAEDRAWLEGPRMALRAQPRLFAAGLSGPIGFRQNDDRRRDTQVLLPQPAGVPRYGQAFDQRHSTLLLRGGAAATLMSSIRAARGLVGSLQVRVLLRRRDILADELEALKNVARLLAAATPDADGDDSDDGVPPKLLDVSREEAQGSIEQLLAHPECLELAVEAADRGSQGRAWLRILGEELFPGFESEVVSLPTRTARRRRGAVIDLSQLLVPGSLPPPLLPAPPMLESLSFPRHYANPAVDMADKGLRLGRAHIGGVVVDVCMPHADRSLHTYALGMTGTGKSTLLFNMAVQDMNAGHGLSVIDPHGDLFEQLLLAVPSDRRGDLLVIDPDDERFCPCLNPLDFGGKPDFEGVTRVTNDLLEIFAHLYDMKAAGGPMFEDYFRHSMLLAAAAPSSGPQDEQGTTPTLVTVGHVLRDRDFRAACVARLDECYGPRAAAEIRQFINLALRGSGDHAFENMALYVGSKLSRFVTNATMRRLFCSGRRLINFRSVMDRKKILLVNLSKGDLGRPDSRFIGMMLIKYLFQAALSRADVERKHRTPFYLYLDEFQNFIATDIPEMLAEARKFGVHLVLANQTLSQLTEGGGREKLDAVLGNVATRLFFRVGQTEAAAVEAGFKPYFDDQALANLPDRHVLCRLQITGMPTMPFVFRTDPPSHLPTGASATRTLGWAVENVAALN